MPVDDAALIVVGSANVDVTLRVERRPGPGETVHGADPVIGAGGKGANTAVAAARLGTVRVAMVGAVGADDGGALLRESLEAAGVDTANLRTVDRPTGGAYITVTPDGENAIVVVPGANAEVSEVDVRYARERIKYARVLFSVLEVPMPAVRAAVACAEEFGVRVVLNASPVAELDPETLGMLDPLVVNEHEARWMVGGGGVDGRVSADSGSAVDAASSTDLEALAGALLKLGPRSVVVTLGADGALVVDRSGTVHVPAPQVEAVDTTGAGDAFAGALSASLAAGEQLVDAARIAVRVAADAVTRPGAQAF